MRGEKNRNMYIPIILFVLIGAAFVGVETVAPKPQYVVIENGCADYTTDTDNDRLYGFIDDTSCHDYPYKDGLGETDTPIGLGGQSPDPYQPYFDLTVDFVRVFIQNECGGNLNGCIGTNYQYESSIEDEKRNIFLLKPSYVAIIEDDIENIMSYGKGSTQYVSKTLKRADNIKLFS